MNFKRLFTLPDAQTLAKRELEEAKRELLLAETQRDYCNAMVAYQTARIHRLHRIIEESR